MGDSVQRLTVEVKDNSGQVFPGTELAGTLKTNNDGVTTFIAEPAYGSQPGEAPSYDFHELDCSLDVFSRLEKDFSAHRPFQAKSVTLDINQWQGDPSSYSPLSVWGGGYVGGNTVTLASNGIQIIEPRIDLNTVHSLLFSNPWHYACVDAKASASTQLGFELSADRKMQKGVQNAELEKFRKFEERIYRMTGQDIPEIFRQASQDYFSTGNMCMEVVYQPAGDIDCIYPVSATTCFRCVTEPYMVQRKYPPTEGLGSPIGEQTIIMPRFMSSADPADYAHLLPLDRQWEAGLHELVFVGNVVISTDPYYGTADILSVLPTLLGDNAADGYNLQFFRNNAIPRYAVMIEGGRVTEDVIYRIKKFLSTEIKQQAHRSIVIPLNRGFKATFQKLDAAPNEASFLAYKGMNREAICAVHKVPPSEVGLWEDANRSNAEQQSKNYLLKVINPHQHKLANIMNHILQYGLDMHGVTFRWKEIELTSEREIATIRQVNAMAKASEAVAVKQIIESLVKAKEGGLAPADAQNTVKTLLDKYKQLLAGETVDGL